MGEFQGLESLTDQREFGEQDNLAKLSPQRVGQVGLEEKFKDNAHWKKIKIKNLHPNRPTSNQIPQLKQQRITILK